MIDGDVILTFGKNIKAKLCTRSPPTIRIISSGYSASSRTVKVSMRSSPLKLRRSSSRGELKLMRSFEEGQNERQRIK